MTQFENSFSRLSEKWEVAIYLHKILSVGDTDLMEMLNNEKKDVV